MNLTLEGLPAEIRADHRFVIVSSPEAAPIAARLLPRQVVLWPSLACCLSMLPMETWMALNGLDILLWPTNTPGARQDMIHVANSLERLTDRLRMVYPADDPEGFSAASMGEWSASRLVEWAKPRARPYVREVAPDPMADLMSDNFEPVDSEPEVPLPAKARRGTPRKKADGAPPAGITQIEAKQPLRSQDTGVELERTNTGQLYCNVANVAAILASNAELVGKIWYDEFYDRIYSTLFGEQQPWIDHHDTRLTMWMQREAKMHKVTTGVVREAVIQHARLAPRNEPKEWLNSLVWDGTQRLEYLFSEGFGSIFDPYTAAVSRCFIVGMVARIMVPGCKLDTMPVLEGSQGVGKSSGLAILGGKWFAESHESVTSKDFFQSLQGKMLLEISELHAFKRAEINRIKGVVSCPVDRYRASYGHYTRDYPRMCVFSGTTNVNDWNEDETGARRFLPVTCRDVDRPWLHRNRDQLFAEAVALFGRVPLDATDEVRLAEGAAWWDIPLDDAMSQQEQRRNSDVWEEPVEMFCRGRNQVTLAQVIESVLEIDLGKVDKVTQLRVIKCLKLAGYQSKLARVAGSPTRVWEKVALRSVT